MDAFIIGIFIQVAAVRVCEKVRNIVGPRTDPCGTPDETVAQEEEMPSTRTLCSRLERKLSIHLREAPEIPILFNLAFSSSCGTRSKALEKSSSMTSTQ